MTIRVAAVQYYHRELRSFEDFVAQLTGYVSTGADYGAKIVLLPELFTFQLLSLSPGLSSQESITPFIEYSSQVRPILERLSKEKRVVIVGGSWPVYENGKRLNVSEVFFPNGERFIQPKLHATPYERNSWSIQGGDSIGTFDVDGVRCGVAICYDIEFPEVARTLTDHGAEIIFVPFWTELPYGARRVRYCAQGAAVSNQCYVVTAGNTGTLPSVAAAQLNYSQNGVFTPLDHGFPRDGIAAELDPNIESVLICDLRIDLLRKHREEGAVTLLKDRRLDLFKVESKAQVVSRK